MSNPHRVCSYPIKTWAAMLSWILVYWEIYLRVSDAVTYALVANCPIGLRWWRFDSFSGLFVVFDKAFAEVSALCRSFARSLKSFVKQLILHFIRESRFLYHLKQRSVNSFLRNYASSTQFFSFSRDATNCDVNGDKRIAGNQSY